MCMVLNRFQIKSFCKVEERDYRTSVLPVDSDSKSQTEVSWLGWTQNRAFHFHPEQTQVWTIFWVIQLDNHIAQKDTETFHRVFCVQ